MKTTSLVFCAAFICTSLIMTSFAFAAPQTNSCNRAITNVKSKLSKQGNPVVRTKQKKIQQNSWKFAPKGNSIDIVFDGNDDWLRNLGRARQFGSQILNSCPQIKLVSFALDQSDYITYFGRVKGQLTFFDEAACGFDPVKTPEWGYYCVPGQ
jgi:hypothetical protein